MTNSSPYSIWYRNWYCRHLFDILHGTEVDAVELCSIFYMVHNCELSSSARHNKLCRSGCWAVLLDILNGTDLGAVEFC